jgi:archaellum biogenesis ATPase FlaH
MSYKDDQTLRDINQALDSHDKELREKKRRQLNTGFALGAEILRKDGKKERTIQEGIKAAYETARRARDTPPDDPEIRAGLENPESPIRLIIEPPGVKLSEVKTQQIDWLWQRRIPLGKITILDGDPGMGKSLLAINIAACVSTGRPMPDDTPGRQGSIILIAPEDSAEDTIKPRMEAAGGDPSKVFLINTIEDFDEKRLGIYARTFSLSRDLDDLEREIKRTNAILVVLDPLMAILGRNIDSSRDQDVREVFTPLAQLAERNGCAILIIRHLNKGTSDKVLYRGAGSIGIIAAARTALLVAHDPDDEQKRVFATSKNNLSKLAPNLNYQVVENEHGTPYIQWLGENHHITSTLLNSGTNLSFERQEILRVLKDAEGPLEAREIVELTGLKYQPLRLMLNRMCMAGDIVRPYRGKFTTLNHPSIARQSAIISDDTNNTSDTNDTKPASDLAPPED